MCSSNATALTDDVRIAHIACSFTLSIVGMFGNSMSLILICKARLYRGSPLMMLIIDLCVANSLSTGLVMPVIAISNIYRRWIFGDIFCQLFGYIMYVTLTSESLILNNLTVCHYLMVVHRVSIKAIVLNRCKYLRLFTLLCLPWVINASALTVPLTATWDTFGYDDRRGYCTLLNKQTGPGFQAAASITLTCIMTLTTFYCYSVILYTHTRSSSRVRRATNRKGAGVKFCTRSVQLMISVIMVNYAVTYLPFLIVSIVDPCITKTPLSVYTAVLYICWSHAAINPFIYALLNTRVYVLWKNTFLCLQSATARTFSSSSLVVRLTRQSVTSRNIQEMV